MASSFGAPERPGLMKVMLRLLLALELIRQKRVVSVGIVIYLIVLETPPETKISFGIVGLCCLMFITATAGLLCATNSRCCIITYVVLALLAAGGELAIAALFHFKKDMAVEEFAKYKKYSEKRVDTFMQVTQYVFFGAAVVEILTIILASIMRCCMPSSPEYEEMDLEQRRDMRRNEAMDKLKLDRMKAEEKMDTKSNRLADRMRAKYGKYTEDDEWDETRSSGIGRGKGRAAQWDDTRL